MTRLVSLLGLVLALGACATTPPLTQAIIVRHAEKLADAGSDPDLSPSGHRRAAALTEIVARAGVAAAFASEYQRTRATVAPTASALGVPLHVVSARDPDALAARIRSEFRGRVVLVAAHSNTVPAIIAALGGPPLPDLDEGAYDDLFVLSWSGDGDNARLLHLRYPDFRYSDER